MRSVVALSVVSVAAACGEPEPAQPDAPVVGVDAPSGAVDASIDGVPFGGPDVSGQFLMAIRLGDAPDDPPMWLQFIADWQLDRTAWELRGSYMPLCKGSCDVPRSAVPPAIPAGDSLLAEWGGHDVIFNGTIPPDANTLSNQPAPLSALMHVRFVSANLVCGVVDATYGGVEYDGTVAAQRIASTDPATLPAPISECPP